MSTSASGPTPSGSSSRPATTFLRSNVSSPKATGTRWWRSLLPSSSRRRRIPHRRLELAGLVKAKGHTQAETDEALRILYRLRAAWNERNDAPAGALKAIELLIGEYEAEAEGKG